jgi:diadenosine tetraphosphatase ApaH/serine/threonine PP2A family protein phosphatase
MSGLTIPPYTVAILADIHGNLDAMEAVLADLAGQDYDALVIAGDLALNGPHPAASLRRIRELGVPTIYGNRDHDLLAEGAEAIALWTRAQLSADDLAYLAALPFGHVDTPPGGASPDDDLLIVHATPTSVTDVLVLEPPPRGGIAVNPTPLDRATRMLGATRAGLIVYGHIHYASAGSINGQRIASIGAVGFPFDGDPRAAYALAHWDGATWTLEHRRVAYDVDRVIAQIHATGMPDADIYARRLRDALWYPAP